jgi:hypothetical protein
MYQSFDFVGKKPSKAQVLAKAKDLASQGSTEIEIFWGENFITLIKRQSPQWLGLCWLKDIDGESIANELNKGIKNA